MSYDIGPRIGIEGETAFKSAVQGINSQLKNLGSEMKAAMAAFDSADQSEEKLTAQNEILARTIEATRSKVELLSSQYDRQKTELAALAQALEQATAEYGEQSEEAARAQNAYNRQAQAVNNLGTQLNTATADLRNMERQMQGNIDTINNLNNEADDGSESMDEMGEAAEQMGLNMKAAAATIGAAFAAIGAAIAEAISFGDEYTKAVNTIKVKTAATAEESKKFGKVLKDIYVANFGEDMQDVSESLSAVIQQLGEGWDNKQLQKITQHAITLRDAFGYEVQESVRASKAMIDQFGISAEEAYGLMAKGAQSGLDYSGELIDNISEFSVHFEKIGLSADDMFNIFQSGTEAGAWSLVTVGDAIKEFSIKAIDGSATSIEGFQAIGMSADEMAEKFASGGDTARDAFYSVIEAIREMDDPVQQNLTGVNLFGTMWEDLGPKVVTQLDNIKGGYDDAAKAMEQIEFDQYNDFGSIMQELGRIIKVDFFLPISEKLVPSLKETAAKLKEAFQNPPLQDSMKRISESLVKLAEGFADFVANQLPGFVNGLSWILDHGSLIAAALAGIGAAFVALKAGKLIVGIIGKVKEAESIFIGLKGLLTALGGPIAIAIAAIAAIGTALFVLWNTNEDFRNAVINIWNTIKDTISGVVNGIVTFFTETIPNAWNSVITFFQNIPTFFAGIWTNIKGTFENGWNAIVAFFAETIPSWISSIGEWFLQLAYKIGEALGVAFVKVQEWGTNIKTFVTQTIPRVISDVSNWFSQLPSKIWAWLTQAIQKMKDWGSQTASTAKTAASNTVNSVVIFFQQLPGKVATWLTQTVQKMIAWGGQMVSTAKTKMSETVNTVVTTLRTLPGKVVSIGSDIIKGIWSGIADMAGWIKGKITDWCGSFVDGFKNALGIQSPSRVMRDLVGMMIGRGISVGMEKSLPTIKKTCAKISTTITAELEGLHKEIAKIEEDERERQAKKELADYEKSIADKYEELGKTELKGQQGILDEIALMKATWEEKQAAAQREADKKMLTDRAAALKEQATQLETFQKKYESALTAITNKQQSMADKISGYGKLLETVKTDTSQYFQVGDLQKDIDQITIYGNALEKLKERGISDSLMGEITSMSVDDAVNYTNLLLSKTDEEYEEYMGLWEEKQRLANEIAKKFYQGELDSLKAEFASKIPQELSELKDNMKTVGIQSAQGLIDGFKSQKDAIITAFTSVIDSVHQAVNKKEEIHSPSRVWARAGDFMAQGLGNGFINKMRTVAQQINDSIPAPTIPENPQLARIGEEVVNGVAQAMQLGGNQKIVIEVPVYLDGKPLTRVVADHWLGVQSQRGVVFG